MRNLSSEIKLLIVGKEGYFEENVKLAKFCGVADRVIFPGMIPYSQVPKYISAMDICIIPFKKGGVSENALPLKLFEYLACGKPVVSSELEGVKKAVGNLVMYAKDSDEYRLIFKKLFDDDSLRYNMGISGREFIEKNYDWKNICEKLENLLIDVQEN
ncbi:GDP-mannose-dependent alpha-(1-6)-phosphatidylinositol monomannoside mannosyltransferase [bioreactor metagenome]|uniref:GDP-mannose-dependent alpha-(1-6)-phosphatidylinositol monomannoside mannosyltransferase n=1 Tax=bioreactor metagenome TaxID=1076179 RepID=A0A644ZZN7_9ZZZZ